MSGAAFLKLKGEVRLSVADTVEIRWPSVSPSARSSAASKMFRPTGASIRGGGSVRGYAYQGIGPKDITASRSAGCPSSRHRSKCASRHRHDRHRAVRRCRHGVDKSVPTFRRQGRRRRRPALHMPFAVAHRRRRAAQPRSRRSAFRHLCRHRPGVLTMKIFNASFALSSIRCSSWSPERSARWWC